MDGSCDIQRIMGVNHEKQNKIYRSYEPPCVNVGTLNWNTPSI
jgi:hypothetical protein